MLKQHLSNAIEHVLSEKSSPIFDFMMKKLAEREKHTIDKSSEQFFKNLFSTVYLHK